MISGGTLGNSPIPNRPFIHQEVSRCKWNVTDEKNCEIADIVPNLSYLHLVCRFMKDCTRLRSPSALLNAPIPSYTKSHLQLHIRLHTGDTVNHLAFPAVLNPFLRLAICSSMLELILGRNLSAVLNACQGTWKNVQEHTLEKMNSRHKYVFGSAINGVYLDFLKLGQMLLVIFLKRNTNNFSPQSKKQPLFTSLKWKSSSSPLLNFFYSWCVMLIMKIIFWDMTITLVSFFLTFL